MSVRLVVIALLTNTALLAAIPQIVHCFGLNKEQWIPCSELQLILAILIQQGRTDAGGAHYQCFMTDAFTITVEMLLHYKNQLLDFPKSFNYSRQIGERLTCWITEHV